MIRAHRVNATAQDDANLISGWNIAPNVEYSITLLPGAVSCGVLLYAEGVLVASGAAITGTDQPCVLLPQGGYALGMIDAEMGWHLMLTTVGTESQRIIRINSTVDLPDEIHPVYADDDLALVRATAGIDGAAHYIDDLAVSCPLGLGAGLGDVVSVPVDGAAVVGQVESITWTVTPKGASESAVIRRHVAIAPVALAEPFPPVVADDTGTATHVETATGNVLANDASGLTVVAVNGLSSNVGQAVDGNNGGSFTIASDGSWAFSPDGDFALLSGSETAVTSVTYHASDGTAEAMATLTVTVSHANAAPVAVNDTGITTADATTSGSVLANDTDAEDDTLTVSQVAGSAANVGVAVVGDNGGLFTVASNGEWTFDPGEDFDALTGAETLATSVSYHVSDGVDEDEGLLTVIVGAPVAQGITLVGTSHGNALTGPYDVSLPELQPGDFILVLTGCSKVFTAGDAYVTTNGYTEFFDLKYTGGASYVPTISCWYKIADGTENSVNVAFAASSGYPGATVVYVLRGVDSTSPFDVAHTSAMSSGSVPNNPSITTVSDGAVVIAVFGSVLTAAGSLPPIPPSGFTDTVFSRYAAVSSNRCFMACMALKSDAEGATDPLPWGDVPSLNSNTAWIAPTLALRAA